MNSSNGKKPQRVVNPDEVVQAAPPLPHETWIHLLGARVGCPLRVVSLGRRVIGVMTHWVPAHPGSTSYRSIPHIEPHERCEGCSTFQQQPRWRGYLPSWCQDFNRCVIAEVTVHAVHSCAILDPTEGKDLRGVRFIFRRTGNNRNSPCNAEVQDPKVPLDKLPIAFDPLVSLCRLWSLQAGALKRMKAMHGAYVVRAEDPPADDSAAN